MNTICTDFRVWALIVAAAGLLPASTHADSPTNIYSTQFEIKDGYNPTQELIGQKGWVTDSLSFGGNGLITNAGSLAAYIGALPLDPPTNSLTIWQPINFAPIAAGKPIVTFSVSTSIVDSTTTNRNDFLWSIYNSRGDRLFSLSFYNVDLGIYYILDGTNNFRYTGFDFKNEVNYTLTITMDFAHNTWMALLNNTTLLVTNLPITTTSSPLDLGDVDAVWSLSNPNRPGDDFMVFDNYQITAQASDLPSAAQLTPLGYTSSGQFLLRVDGTPNSRFAIEATTNFLQWTALKTNVLIGGSSDFLDNISPPAAQRFYRARLVP